MISIIVPIYRIENYLAPCLDSILNSTYRDFELILVDDGSPDNCGAICDNYAGKDSRVSVIHQENAGVAAARNTGLKMASGEYVMFIDGDDVIHSRMIELLHDAIVSGDYDFSMAYVKVVLDNQLDCRLLQNQVDDVPAVVLSQKDYMENLCTASMQYHSVCNKLYKRSLVDGLEFFKFGAEDMEWCNRMCLRMNQAVLLELVLYFYVQRATSEMHSGVTKLFVDRINTALVCLEDIPQENTYYLMLRLQFIYKMIFYVRYVSRHSELYGMAKANSRNAYKKTKKELLRTPYISWRRKLYILFSYHCPLVFNAVQSAIIRIGR